jgi:hypothetical protein
MARRAGGEPAETSLGAADTSVRATSGSARVPASAEQAHSFLLLFSNAGSAFT